MPTLKVHLQEARSLVAKDIKLLGRNSSDPYVYLSVGSTKYKSSVVMNNLNPKWNQNFEFKVHGPQDTLHIEAFDRDQLTADDSLGKARVGLSSLYKGVPADMWVKLEGVKSGEVRLTLTAVDFGKTKSEPPKEQPKKAEEKKKEEEKKEESSSPFAHLLGKSIKSKDDAKDALEELAKIYEKEKKKLKKDLSKDDYKQKKKPLKDEMKRVEAEIKAKRDKF